ncbi:MAG: tetratricopeptide repeat protein [Acidobacteriaceae bacterium]|nr:tetratricopeptide repeat protein [Acidobacteriaceae bacterium]MBV9677682.1 tetratricopeptide repeat protein [Acidobacteriaceae bacterium]
MTRSALLVLYGATLFAQTSLDGQKAEARRLFAENHLTESAALWRSALVKAPEDVDCLLNLGIVEDALGHFVKANNYLSQAAKLYPRSTSILNNLAVNYVHLGRSNEAIRTLQHSLELNGNNPNALYNLGSLYLDSGKWSEAAATLERVARLAPDDEGVRLKLSSAHMGIAKDLLQKGKLQESLSEFQAAIDAHPNDPKPYIGAVLALLKGEAIEGAMTVLAEAKLRFPNNLRLLLETGYAQQLQDNWAAAAESYRQAVQADPGSVLARVFLGRAYRELGQPDKSITVLREAAQLSPDSSLASYELAETLLSADPGNPEASTLLERAAKIDPHRAEPNYLLGKIALQRGDFAKAEHYLRLASTADPNLPQPHYLLAQVYRKEENVAKAAEETAVYQRLKKGRGGPGLRDIAPGLQP